MNIIKVNKSLLINQDRIAIISLLLSNYFVTKLFEEGPWKKCIEHADKIRLLDSSDSGIIWWKCWMGWMLCCIQYTVGMWKSVY